MSVNTRNNEKIRFVIFGAGSFGRKALLWFGCDKVDCFLDNDQSKNGTIYCEKRVYLPSEYQIKKEDNVVIVIACKLYHDIYKKTKSLYPNNSIMLYHPECEFAFRTIDEKIDKIYDRKVAILGVNSVTQSLYLYLLWKGAGNVAISEIPGNQNLGTMVDRMPVRNFLEIKDEVESVVVIPDLRSALLEYWYSTVEKDNDKIINHVSHRRTYETADVIENPYHAQSPWGDKDGPLTEEDYKKRIQENYDYESIANECFDYMDDVKPLFNQIDIETINRCNLNCSFCPAGKSRDTRVPAIMEEWLFVSIVDQLADMNYDGRFQTFLNNEPFLDERIITFNKYARGKLPNAHISLYCNGTLLNEQRFFDIIEHIDDLVIDNYSKQLEVLSNLKGIVKICENDERLKKKVTVVLRRPDDILTSRAGDAPNRNIEIFYPRARCTAPWFQLCVRPTGEISACCADVPGHYTLGDLRKQSLLEAWYGDEYKKFRKKMSNGREGLDHCRYCDAFHFW